MSRVPSSSDRSEVGSEARPPPGMNRWLILAGYGLLALTYWLCHPSLYRPYRHFHYLAGLAILCVMLVYQANRTRALARIGGERLRA